jgi:hypothetical protein
LNEIASAPGSALMTAKILLPTLNTRSLPHWMVSAAPGNERQSLLIARTRAAAFTGAP